MYVTLINVRITNTDSKTVTMYLFLLNVTISFFFGFSTHKQIIFSEK